MKTRNMPSFEKGTRKKTRVASQRLAACHAVVIGAGTLGRAVAILLASLGIKHLSIYDPSFVTKKDLTCGFMDEDMGFARVDAVANIAHQHNPRMELLTYRSWLRKPHLHKWKKGLTNVVFFCGKSYAERQLNWKRIKASAEFLCDGRIERDIIRLTVFTKPATVMHFALSLLPHNPDRSFGDLINANLIAALMIWQFTRWSHQFPPGDVRQGNQLHP